MASLNPTSIVNRLLDSLGGLAKEKITGVDDRVIEKLAASISGARDVLVDAENRAREDRRVSIWIERLGDVLHEADDIVDELRTEILRKSLLMQRGDRVVMKRGISGGSAFTTITGHWQFLLDRDFFEAVGRDISGKATKCKMSVAMHDLAAAVAGKECIKLGLDQDHQNTRDFPHQVSFEFPLSSPRQIPTSFKEARIRSILFPCQSSIKQEGSSSRAICDAIVSDMKFLRTLDLHDSGIETMPDHIDELKHLRYLDLSRNVKIKVLPHSITKLLNLQTLKLSLCFRLKELPRDIKNLVNLRHLEIDGCYNLTHMPRGLGQLTQLETLSQFVLCKDARSVFRHDIGQLNELSSLNNLRGELQIKNLRHDTDVESACLKDKQFLHSLALDWEIGTRETGGHEALVTSLEPHTNLGGLTLIGYRGDTLPIGPSMHNKLVKLVLRRCPNCRYLPPLHLCTSLKVLALEEMSKLEYVSENVRDESVSSPALMFFPSLQELHLTELPLLRSWWRGVECNKDHKFPCLSKLFIENCPELVSMPLFPTLEEGLVLDSCNLKPFQETIMMNTEYLRLWTSAPADEASSSTSVRARPSSFSPPLSKLKNLSIVGIEELDNKEAEGIMWENLTSLEYLRLDYLPSLEYLPDELRNVTRLRELHIWRCSFTALPEWIIKLRSLRKLSIWICPDLKSLPEEIGNLTSLRTLEIEDCPTLLHRCQRKAGADWDKIARIPDLRLDLNSRK
ncbi:hypothetical protein TIFTF001_042651 [Ficus carica]|uniref:Rx N-terminal domain-containing protein n=1 Tax=Ficus carica TaxID=3494 RepID=A0AA88A576_FICCA|nr:hypothetical protein TIFTF001_042651 [Ficus carica]